MLDTGRIAEAVRGAIVRAASELRPDVHAALRQAHATERSPRGRGVIEQLLQNADIAAADSVPLCQDTGTVWVWVEIGAQECLREPLQAPIDQAVSSAYREAGLRMSVARDALFDRSNTGDNTPAFLDVTMRPGTGATVHVMLKGGGSDNASQVVMVPPGAGEQGVREVVMRAVELNAPNACPPLVVGVGVGSTFDKVGVLSKRALLRRIGTSAASPAHAAFERSLLADINAVGIGPGGMGGDTTALAVHVATAPCHIASLPVAVNVGCCAIRSVSVDVA